MVYELLGCCPACGFEDISNCHWQYERSRNNRLIALHCARCYVDMTLYWDPREMVSYDSIEADREAIDEYERWLDYTDDYDDELDGFSMLCCDKQYAECQCPHPLYWTDALEKVLEVYDDISDMYEYANNLEAKLAGAQSCLNCSWFRHPVCPSLRNNVYSIATGVLKRTPPIRLCDSWEKTPIKDYLDDYSYTY